MQDNLIKSLTRLHYLDLLYWTQIWWACNVTTGLLCTGLIVGRLWFVFKSCTGVGLNPRLTTWRDVYEGG